MITMHNIFIGNEFLFVFFEETVFNMVVFKMNYLVEMYGVLTSFLVDLSFSCSESFNF